MDRHVDAGDAGLAVEGIFLQQPVGQLLRPGIIARHAQRQRQFLDQSQIAGLALPQLLQPGDALGMALQQAQQAALLQPQPRIEGQPLQRLFRKIQRGVMQLEMHRRVDPRQEGGPMRGLHTQDRRALRKACRIIPGHAAGQRQFVARRQMARIARQQCRHPGAGLGGALQLAQHGGLFHLQPRIPGPQMQRHLQRGLCPFGQAEMQTGIDKRHMGGAIIGAGGQHLIAKLQAAPVIPQHPAGHRKFVQDRRIIGMQGQQHLQMAAAGLQPLQLPQQAALAQTQRQVIGKQPPGRFGMAQRILQPLEIDAGVDPGLPGGPVKRVKLQDPRAELQAGRAIARHAAGQHQLAQHGQGAGPARPQRAQMRHAVGMALQLPQQPPALQLQRQIVRQMLQRRLGLLQGLGQLPGLQRDVDPGAQRRAMAGHPLQNRRQQLQAARDIPGRPAGQRQFHPQFGIIGMLRQQPGQQGHRRLRPAQPPQGGRLVAQQAGIAGQHRQQAVKAAQPGFRPGARAGPERRLHHRVRLRLRPPSAGP